jgi:tetratricopeptide (TPR) repeat protein
LRRAIALDPLSARVNIDAGWLLLQAHRFDDAIRQARRALELEPGLAEANACIQRSLLYQKKYRELLADIQKSGPNPEQTLKRLYREKLQKDGTSGKADSFSLATTHVFLGENDRALDELENALAKHNIMMPLLRTEPTFDPLHNEPRFQALTRKLALP